MENQERTGPLIRRSPAERRRLHDELVKELTRMGHPREFAEAIAAQLGTEMTMDRMIRYLHQARPRSAEEIADEMLAICADRDRWRDKKVAEYYNQKYNEWLNQADYPGEDEE